MRTGSHLFGLLLTLSFYLYVIVIMSLKKILLYNSPSNVVNRFRMMTGKQIFLFADGILMLIGSVFFYNLSNIFDNGLNVVLGLVCLIFSIISFALICYYDTRKEQ